MLTRPEIEQALQQSEAATQKLARIFFSGKQDLPSIEQAMEQGALLEHPRIWGRRHPVVMAAQKGWHEAIDVLMRGQKPFKVRGGHSVFLINTSFTPLEIEVFEKTLDALLRAGFEPRHEFSARHGAITQALRRGQDTYAKVLMEKLGPAPVRYKRFLSDIAQSAQFNPACAQLAVDYLPATPEVVDAWWASSFH